MADGGLLSVLGRVGALADEIRAKESQLDEEIRQASRAGGSCRTIARWAGMSAATVNRRLARRLVLTPEAASELVAARAELAARRLELERLAYARRRLRLGEQVDLDELDVDELVREAIHAADGIAV